MQSSLLHNPVTNCTCVFAPLNTRPGENLREFAESTDYSAGYGADMCDFVFWFLENRIWGRKVVGFWVRHFCIVRWFPVVLGSLGRSLKCYILFLFFIPSNFQAGQFCVVRHVRKNALFSLFEDSVRVYSCPLSSSDPYLIMPRSLCFHVDVMQLSSLPQRKYRHFA